MRKNNINNGLGTIFVSYHKPFKILNSNIIVPIHAGRLINEESKDGKLKNDDIKWLTENTIGDDSGDNISIKNREYCECTVLYWIWKNINYWNLQYVGLMQYHRYLIFNDLFEKRKNNIEKDTYKCIIIKSKTKNILNKIGIDNQKIINLLDEFDCIIPYPSELKNINILSIYEDYASIKGLHIDDLICLKNLMSEIDFKNKNLFSKYLESPRKIMYQMFIVKPNVFNDYSKWLFNILSILDKKIDTSFYSINGKRTMGYLAEILYGYYFSLYRKDLKIKNLGIAFIE